MNTCKRCGKPNDFPSAIKDVCMWCKYKDVQMVCKLNEDRN